MERSNVKKSRVFFIIKYNLFLMHMAPKISLVDKRIALQERLLISHFFSTLKPANKSTNLCP